MTLVNFLLFAEHESPHVLTAKLDLERIRALRFDEDVIEIRLSLRGYTVRPIHLPTEGYVSGELRSWAEDQLNNDLTFGKDQVWSEFLSVYPDGLIQVTVYQGGCNGTETEWFSEWLDLEKLS